MKKDAANEKLYALSDTLSQVASHIEIDGWEFITVENCRSVLRYSGEHILLNMGTRHLQIVGSELCILNMFSSTIRIRGQISSLEFLRGR